MYFLPRSSALFYRFIHVKPLYRYGITLVCLFVLTVVWLFAIYTFLDSRIVQAQAALKVLGDQEQLLVQSSKDLVQLNAQIAANFARLQELKKTNKGMTLQSAMIALINKAGMCGLNMQSCNAIDHKHEQWYTKNSVQLDVSGSLDQLFKYIQLISTDQHLMALVHCTLTHLNDADLFNAQCGLEVIEIRHEQSDFVA